MASLVVTYPVRDDARFDVKYYVATHLPLVEAKWRQHGLVATRALLPAENTPAYAAIAILEFADAAAVARALGSDEAADVFGDVANFTDLTPVAQQCL